MENKIYKLTDEEFIDLVKSSLNRSEVLFKLGYTTDGNSWGYSQVKQRMLDLNLSGKDFRGTSTMVSMLSGPTAILTRRACPIFISATARAMSIECPTT